MSRFTGPLSVMFGESDDGRGAVLLEPLVWECDTLGSGLIVTVPAGYMSDGASVPRLFWAIMPAWGDIGSRAAILHDWLCEQVDMDINVPGAETRRKCDMQFRLALLALMVNFLRAWTCWFFVRIFSVLRAIVKGNQNG